MSCNTIQVGFLLHRELHHLLWLNVWQPVTNRCVDSFCGVEFAQYFCSICKFYDDDAKKAIYHCDKCKICRIGKGLDIDYFHCDRCNACMSISLKKHKCVERSLESDCPICHTFMFTSTTPVMFLPCGHCMHVTCYEEYTLVRKSLFESGRSLLYLSQIMCARCARNRWVTWSFISRVLTSWWSASKCR